ncbi:DUF3422 domain-containing protein [Octadecabacter sp. 1_MG-2023]|uniref:DUF3422 family protein n=1 Tax=unclassified Octadecabacter TaxID=196158 RepID=UPI001C0A014E|nr:MULTISPECIES: DUF3422 domain-containing protein [unclassified Octadecabacter]MBU2992976.1 DUF3422 domain-containing protein [Octadecabacter sp. B2R22]MDO6733572.1 DUF3422 domain-containing protein [Octadecabacter sp. 1_MG-2023]
MSPIADHPLRYALANELHARPFPTLDAPCRAAYLAIKPAQNAAGRDRAADMEHLKALLDHYAAPHPEEGATHYFGQVGRHLLKWESHTEFVTYTVFGEGVAKTPFDAATFGMFPEDWLANAPGTRVTSALIRVEQQSGDAGIGDKVNKWFVPESVAVSRVLDDDAVIAGDYRIDQGGHMRFAVFSRPETGERRVGRIVQRLCEVETYKAMAMLGFSRCRDLGRDMGALDGRLNGLTEALSGAPEKTEETLDALLQVSGELESLSAQSTFRFGATAAYEKIVNQRIEVLRESRFEGRQTFGEFMMRRFDPAMRTVASTKERLDAMSSRAIRASDLLRTRVDVERSAENKALLESMDRRADIQLRLQETVEGLSIVAISYYGVNLAANVTAPFAYELGLGDKGLKAVLTPIVIGLVWLMVRRIRNALH